MKNRRFLVILFLIGLLSFGSLNMKPKADSGWDSSYDSGSSWNSGSSHDSSWNSDSYHYNRSGNYSSSEGSSSSFIIFLIVIIIIIIVLSNRKQIYSNSLANTDFNDVSDDILKKYGINLEQFKDMVYKKYVNIQEAWMNFNYKGLQKNLTDELYNTYIMQLDALKLKKQKNIMKDFKLIDCKIVAIKEENGLLNIDTYLRVEMYDYVIDKDKKVVRGNEHSKIDIEYLITFVKTSKDSNEEVSCPNCGAKLDIVSSSKCEYCGSVIVVDAKEYVMSKKTCIGQRNK